MKKFIWLICLLLFICYAPLSLAGGLFGSQQVLLDHQIEDSLRQKITQLNQRVISCFRNNTEKELLELFTPGVRITNKDAIIALLKQRGVIFKENDFHQNWDCLVSRDGIGSMATTFACHINPEIECYLSLEGKKRKWISTMITSGKDVDIMLTLVWEEIDEQWFLSTIDMGIGAIGGQFANQWLVLAENALTKGNLLRGYLATLLAKKSIQPASFIRFAIKENLADLEDGFDKRLQLPSFPLQVSDSGTTPPAQINGIQALFRDNEPLPLIDYSTALTLDNTDKLTEEANMLLATLDTILPGFQDVSSQVFFHITSLNDTSHPPVSLLLANERE